MLSTDKTDQTEPPAAAAPADPPSVVVSPRSSAARWKSMLSLRRIAGVYLFVVMFVVFAVTIAPGLNGQHGGEDDHRQDVEGACQPVGGVGERHRSALPGLGQEP